MDVLILLAVLACPIVMGTMMLLMRRETRARSKGRDADADAAPPPTGMTGERRDEAGRSGAHLA